MTEKECQHPHHRLCFSLTMDGLHGMPELQVRCSNCGEYVDTLVWHGYESVGGGALYFPESMFVEHTEDDRWQVPSDVLHIFDTEEE